MAGVNDAPAAGEAFAYSDAESKGANAGAVASFPVSSAMLADEKARIAKYGTPELATAEAGSAAAAFPPQPPTATGRPRIYDASEGTKLDPLLNKTYDLSYPKVVPALSP